MKLEDGYQHIIVKSDMEKDLGIMLASDLKWKHQVEKSVKSANSIIAQIRNSFKYLDIKLVDLLYKTLVRTHVEYAVPVWNPYLSQDIRSLEKIQRKASSWYNL